MSHKKGTEIIPFLNRFEKYVEPSGGCWLWLGGKTFGGYGVIHKNGVKVRAHRASYELFLGKIPTGSFACHSCDNPPCVNPWHIFIGTQKENMADASQKGRIINSPKRGEENSMAILNEGAVLRMRKMKEKYGFRQCEIMKIFGLNKSIVNAVLNRRTWAWVN